MRTTGMGRGFAALLVLAMACGCTVQGSGEDGGDGKRHLPVRIEVPKRSTPPAQDPGPGATPSAQDPKPGATPPSTSAASGPVLWSRGDTGPGVRELQARLRQVAWLYDGPTGSYDDLTERAVKGFQGKRGLPRTGRTDTVTWKRLKAMTREPGKWELYLMGGQPADAPDPRCLTGRVLCISKTSRTLRWMIDGRTLTTVSVRFGSVGTPTR